MIGGVLLNKRERKQMRKRILYFIIQASCCFSLTACSKWLDVQPESLVDDKELFNSPQGFEEALNGIYTRASQRDLYGDELLVGLPDVMAQNYTISVRDNEHLKYGQTALFNFTDPDFRRRRNDAWSGLYHAIANCNLILENIDLKKTLFDDAAYKLIKGEALGLRAFLHFDLLRLFGPSYLNGASAPAIPYVNSYSNKVTALSTVTEVINQVLTDLLSAKELLSEVDPIIGNGYVVGYPDDDKSTESDGHSLFLQNRRHRLNYYAVCGALARVYLYGGNDEEALVHARMVIDSKKFPWTREIDFVTGDLTQRDRILYPELIFAWSIPNLRDPLADKLTGAVGLYMDVNNGRTLYEAGGIGAEDFRFKSWINQVNNGGESRFELQKYRRSNDGNRHPLVAPALRLSELYYIAAESSFASNPQNAQAYMDSVRIHRGIATPFNISSRNTFTDELIKEYRKEFYGEGQVFYAYKRLHKDIIGQNNRRFTASNNIFVLPFPEDEIEFGNR